MPKFGHLRTNSVSSENYILLLISSFRIDSSINMVTAKTEEISAHAEKTQVFLEDIGEEA